jgi:polysaccharide export outer membrane protein
MAVCCASITLGLASLSAAQTPSRDEDYRIGPNDVLSIAVLQASELNTSVRVSEQGEVSIGLAGIVPVGGLTLRQAEQAIKARLQQKYIRDPEVVVQVTEIQSHPISVLGAVRKPGVFQVRGTKTLLEVLSLAEGVADTAGDSVIVMRGQAGIGGPATEGSPTAAPIEVKLKTLLASTDPAANISIHPGDVVKVPQAAMVYVVGEVKKPGAFPMPSNEKLTVLRAIALGEGLAPTAAKGDVLILRSKENGERHEIAVHLDRILKSKETDIVLQAQDVLFVPTSGGKAVARGTLDALTRILSWRPIP